MQQEWSTCRHAVTLAALRNGLFSAQSQRSGSVTDDAYRSVLVNVLLEPVGDRVLSQGISFSVCVGWLGNSPSPG